MPGARCSAISTTFATRPAPRHYHSVHYRWWTLSRTLTPRQGGHAGRLRPNEMWQTDFTYFKIIGWGWVYLSTVLDDYSRYIIAWKLCTTTRAEDVIDTLELA